MAVRHLLAEVGSDRDGETVVGRHMTLGSIRDAVNLALNAGVSEDSPIKHGYLPERLADGIYVEQPEDLTRVSVDTLLGRVQRGATAERGEAWAEIKRRIEEIHD